MESGLVETHCLFHVYNRIFGASDIPVLSQIL